MHTLIPLCVFRQCLSIRNQKSKMPLMLHLDRRTRLSHRQSEKDARLWEKISPWRQNRVFSLKVGKLLTFSPLSISLKWLLFLRSSAASVRLWQWKALSKICPIHSADLRGPNLSLWWGSGHSGTWCLNDCLCKHTDIGRELRDFHPG